MKKRHVCTIVIVLLSLGLATASYAQPGMHWRGSGGWGPGSQYGRLYNPQAVEAISGEIVRVDRITPMRGMGGGVHVLVKTATETLDVHLGPRWYIENQDVQFAPKDYVEVRGSRVTVGGKPAIIAAAVQKGDGVLTLRDDQGVPLWSGWRRR
jgi:hypothetical protein